MSDEEIKAQFAELDKKLDQLAGTVLTSNNLELAANTNVVESIADLKATISPAKVDKWIKEDGWFRKIGKVDWAAGMTAAIATVEGILSAVKIFTSDATNWADKTAIMLKTVGSAIEILSAIPVVGWAFTVAGGLFKVVGTIFGFLGAPQRSKEDVYFEALTNMVNEAVDRTSTEQVNQQLNGALMHLRSLKRVTCDLNASFKFNGKTTAPYPELNVTLFATAGDEALGAGIQHLEYSVQDLSKTVAALNLQTFYYTFDLFVEKYLLIVQGITYFFWFEMKDAEAEITEFESDKYKGNYEICNRTTVLLNYLYEQYDKVFSDFLVKWFVKPDISHSVLTTRIYAGDDKKFRLIAQQAARFNATCWPVGFEHQNGSSPFRMTTVSEYRGDVFPNGSALRGFLSSDDFRILEDNAWLTEHGFSTRLRFEYLKGAEHTGEAVQNWKLAVYNTNDSAISKVPVYVFYVTPTDAEKEKFFPYETSNSAIRENRTLIIGIPGTDKVYVSRIDKEAKNGNEAQEARMVEANYVEALFSTSKMANHEHLCPVWVLDDFKNKW